jgi:uncharacterized protein
MEKGNRLELLRRDIDKIIKEKRGSGGWMLSSHLYGVSNMCVLLAIRRGLNPEIAAICGILHDIYDAIEKDSEDHAKKGAEEAKKILKSYNLYSDDEIYHITTAIFKHSDKLNEHESYTEVLIDADVMNHCLYNPDFPIKENERVRYEKTLIELGCNPTA